MKWKKVVTLIITSILCLETIIFAEELTEDFRVPKNILFAGMLGESSHVNWVLAIMDELRKRGHRVTFLTKDDHVKFGKRFPLINTISTGPPSILTSDILANITRETILELSERHIKDWTVKYPSEYTTHRDVFRKLKVDIILCDHTNMACVDVAHTENIPFIVTATAATSNDSNAPYINGNIFQGHDPTTLYESFITRFYNMFLEPVQWGWYLRRSVSDLMKQKARVGIRSVGLSLDLFWGDSLKLVNNVFGIEPARPMGPLVELVGPIISRTYDPLTDNFRQFLDTHHHVAYIAFGQHGTPTADDVKLILTALLENIEQNTIDGFLWATTTKNFPQSVTTSSNKTYIISDLFNKADGTSDTMLVNWAPQQAVLQHPSVSFFLSHGGVTSLFEGMFSGKRMIIFPFLCDQHANAVAVEHYQLGGRFDYKTPQDQVNELMGKVALDVDGSIQENVNKHKALVQIHSRSGAKRGADFVEEVAFMNKNGKLPHRYEVAREMSFMKARNLDLYFAFISTLAIPTVLAYKIIRFIAPKGTQAILHKEKAKKM